MHSSFETTPRTIAIAPDYIEAVLGEAMENFAAMAPDGGEMLACIAAHWDDEERTRIRAASLVKGSATPVPVGDGRICFTALWEVRLAAAFDAGEIPHAEEIAAADITSPTEL